MFALYKNESNSVFPTELVLSLALYSSVMNNKLGLSCVKLRIVELKMEDNIIFGLNENWGEKHEW